MSDSLDSLLTAFSINTNPFDPDWKGEEIIKNVRDYDYPADEVLQTGRRKPGRPPSKPPMPADPRRYDAQILLAYHAGLSRDEIAKRAGCDPFHVMRRIAYHTS